MTGNAYVENRLYDGEALGMIVHFTDSSSIWAQELFHGAVVHACKHRLHAELVGVVPASRADVPAVQPR